MLELGVLVVATRNAGKAREFAALLGPRGFEVRSLNDFDDLPDIVEDGDTFAANARKKASVIAKALGVDVLADDSGLCVDALGGEPGVYSARYAGEGSTDAANNAKLLAELRRRIGEPDARLGHPLAMSEARFVCALSLCGPGGEKLAVEAACEGLVLAEPAGEHGFGYDPFFYLPEQRRTMAELTTEEKNGISHRARALSLLLDKLGARSTR